MKLKYSIALFALFLFLRIYGQSMPEGRFIFSTGFEHREFTFSKNNRFQYLYSSCTSGQSGSGTYSLRNKKLILVFEGSPASDSLEPVLERRELNGDTAVLHFTFFYLKDSSPVKGMIITTRLKNTLDARIATQSDKDGTTELRLSKKEFPVRLTITDIGMPVRELSIKEAANYVVRFPVRYETMVLLAKGVVLEFDVHRMTSDTIALRKQGEKTNEWYLRLRR